MITKTFKITKEQANQFKQWVGQVDHDVWHIGQPENGAELSHQENEITAAGNYIEIIENFISNNVC